MTSSREETFSRSRRVRRRADFVRIQEVGARVATRHFILLVAARSDDPDGLAHFGLVVSKRIGGAVTRNLVKRRLREALRRAKGAFPNGCDVVVIARAGAGELSAEDVRRAIERAIPDVARRAASERGLAPATTTARRER